MNKKIIKLLCIALVLILLGSALGGLFNTGLGATKVTRIRMLSEMEKDYEGYSRAVKTVMQEAGLTLLCGALYIVGMIFYKNYMEKKKK